MWRNAEHPEPAFPGQHNDQPCHDHHGEPVPERIAETVTISLEEQGSRLAVEWQHIDMLNEKCDGQREADHAVAEAIGNADRDGHKNHGTHGLRLERQCAERHECGQQDIQRPEWRLRSDAEVVEQRVRLTEATGETRTARRVVIQFEKPTRNGDQFVVLLTNLANEAADALTVSELYRKRWGIETAFQKLESHLHSEINTLGYPKAALFGFCLALVAFNLYAIVMAALRSSHRDRDINAEVSEYYSAGEIARTYTGMVIAIPETDWTIFAQASRAELSDILLSLAAKTDLSKFKKNKRGQKKPPTPRNKFKGHPHVSTARLLASTSTG